jgi:cell division protein FtsQ
MTRRRQVKVKSSPTTRVQAAAEFGRKKARQRRNLWWRHVAMVGGGTFVFSALVAGWWLNHVGRLAKAEDALVHGFWNITADVGFKLDQVTLVGRSYADAGAIRDALAITKGQPILALSLDGMKQRLEAIPEVKAVVLTRTLPSQLTVHLVERKPAALWQHGAQKQMIDGEGVVLAHDKYGNQSNLPVIVGDDAPKHVAELLALIDSAPSIKPDVVAAMRVGKRRWNVQMKRNIMVMLPEENAIAAWQRFATLVARDALLNKAIRSVDMRIEDRVFIMPLEQKQSPVTLTTARDT